MAQAQLQEELIPSGGIADFVMSDAEIAALEAEEAREEFGQEGIARFEPIAKRMASYGRFGDDNLAHVETGEILVPRALIDQSPELKESIFNHLREMGVENPERYVVGSGANSINPDTGMPEFFFKSIARAVKKTVSNVAKGVSKAVSKVGKVLKKVAPVVLPVVLTPILGPVYAGAVGSGIGSLLNGGSLKDAVKAAALGGATGAVFAGATGNKGSFFENIKAATAAPGARFGQLSKAIGESASTGSFKPLMQSYTPGSEIADDIAAGRAGAGEAEAQSLQKQLAGPDTVTTTKQIAADTNIVGGTRSAGSPLPDVGSNMSYDVNDPIYKRLNELGGEVLVADQERFLGQGLSDAASQYSSTLPKFDASTFQTEPTVFDTLKGYAKKAGEVYDTYLSPSRASLTADVPKVPSYQEAFETVKASMGANTSPVVLDSAAQDLIKTATAQAAKAAPGIIETYGPLAAAGGLAAYGAGFFDAAPQEDPNLVDRRTGADLLAENADQYMVGGRTPQYSTGQTVVGTRFGYDPRRAPVYMSSPFVRPQMYAAEGGEVYPRRNGGIMPNEGIPDQDSVRALLMPGEFVMTKDAVKGLGGGSMTRGIDNMYSMMRNLEAKGQVA